MDEQEIARENACLDLVCTKRDEPFMRLLLGKGRPGQWLNAREACQEVGVMADGLTAGVFVSWLPDPAGETGYAIILFYEPETLWSTVAHYNRALVLGEASGESNGSSIRPAFAGPPDSMKVR